MPHWGRPPGARLKRRSRNAWDSQSWGYDPRFEELDDTDEDDLHGVELDRGYAQKRYVSDELHFTGMDLGSGKARQRRSENVYNEHSDSEAYGYDNDPTTRRPYNVQFMLREKEDQLVERALERIARARAMGKTNVKLSQAEIDALERAERRQQMPPPPPELPAPLPKPAAKNKKSVPPKAKVAERKKASKSSNNSPKINAIEPARRGRSSTDVQEDALIPYPVMPEQYGPGRGAVVPAPNYYAPPQPPTRRSRGSSRPNSRAASSHPQRQPPTANQPLAYHQHPYFQGRYYSTPDFVQESRRGSASSQASRPDPAEPDWEPRARSTSNVINYPINQLPKPTHRVRVPRFDPNDPRFASPNPRRVVSGPPAAYPSQMYSRSQDELLSPPSGSQSPVSDGEYAEEPTTTEDDDDTEDSLGGTEVELAERSEDEYVVSTRSAAPAEILDKRRPGPARRKRR